MILNQIVCHKGNHLIVFCVRACFLYIQSMKLYVSDQTTEKPIETKKTEKTTPTAGKFLKNIHLFRINLLPNSEIVL